MKPAALEQLLTKERNVRRRIYLLLSLADHSQSVDLPRALHYAEEALSAASKDGSHDLVGEAELFVGKLLSNNARYSEAVKHVRHAIRIFEQSENHDARLDAEYELANVRIRQDKSKEALLPLHRMLFERERFDAKDSSRKSPVTPIMWDERILRKHPSSKKLHSNNLLKLGNIYSAIGSVYASFVGYGDKAIANLEKALSLWSRTSNNVFKANTLNNLGVCYLRMDRSQPAIRYLKQSYAINKKLHRQAQVAINLGNLSHLYYESGKLELGRETVKTALALCRKSGLQRYEAALLCQTANVEHKHGSRHRALQYANEAVEYFEAQEPDRDYINAFAIQIEILFARKPSRDLYDNLVSLYTLAVHSRVDRQYNVAKELYDLAARLKLYPEMIYWLNTVHNYRLHQLGKEQEKRIAILEEQQKVEQLAQQATIYRIERQQLTQNLRAKEREIELLAGHLAKKNSSLNAIIQTFRSLQRKDATSRGISVDEAIRIVEVSAMKNTEFAQIEERALRLYRNLLLYLQEQYPSLSQTEVSICILLKLGLSTKDISNVKFTSLRTIENQCLAIRKKLNVPKSVRLSRFIRNISVTPS